MVDIEEVVDTGEEVGGIEEAVVTERVAIEEVAMEAVSWRVGE